MKNKFLSIILVALICFLNIKITISNAAGYTPIFTCDSTDCLLMCAYEETTKEITENWSGAGDSAPLYQPEIIEIFYDVKTKVYQISYGEDSSDEHKVSMTIDQLIAETTSVTNHKVYGTFVDGRCPDDVYVDLSLNTGFEKEICFDYINGGNLQNLCKSYEDEGIYSKMRFTSSKRETSYTSIEKTKEKTEKKYDLSGQVKKVIDNEFKKYTNENHKIYPDKNLSENPFCQRVLDEGENFAENEKTSMLNLIEAAVQKNFFSTVAMPSWINTAHQYSAVTDYFTSGPGLNLMRECESVITNDTELSSSEKNEMLPKIREAFNIFYSDIYKHFSTVLSFNFSDDFSGPESCVGFLGEVGINTSPAYYLDLILNLMRYGAVILTLVLSIIDFIKAITSQDKDMLIKVTGTSVKRLVFTIIIFFLPILIKFVLGLFGAYNTCIE